MYLILTGDYGASLDASHPPGATQRTVDADYPYTLSPPGMLVDVRCLRHMNGYCGEV